MKKKGQIKKDLLIFLEVMLLFGIVEGMLRVSGKDRVGAEKHYSNIYDPITTFVPGAQNPYTQVQEFINKKGLRGADFDKRKPRNVFRIICLGDSRTFGMVHFDNAFPTILQDILNQGPRKKRYEVINAGIPGTNLYQQRLFFENSFKNTDMDLILLLPEPNYRADIKRFRDAMSRPEYEKTYKVRKLLSHSAIFRVLRKWTRGKPKSLVLDDSQLKSPQNFSQEAFLSDFREDLAKMLELAKKRKSGLVLLSNINPKSVGRIIDAKVGSEDENYNSTARKLSDELPAFEFAEKNGLLFIDLAKDFLLMNQTEPGLWVDETHPGPLGNRIIAKKIARTLSEHHLIPDFYSDK